MINTHFNWRMLAVVLHDAAMTAVALGLAVSLTSHPIKALIVTALLPYLPLFIIYASGVYAVFRLYRSKWRFASVPDLANIFKASLVLGLTLLIADYTIASSLAGNVVFGKVTLFLYTVLQMMTLGAARLFYRYYRFKLSLSGAKGTRLPVLLIGNGAEADMLLRAIETQAIANIHPVGILMTGKARRGQSIRQVRVLGGPDDFERAIAELEQNQQRPRRVIVLPSALPELDDAFFAQLQLNGIPAQKLSFLRDAHDQPTVQLESVEIEDLLFRGAVHIDDAAAVSFIKGKRVVVTGGAGSIGTELCQRALAFGCAGLLVIDFSEAALVSLQHRLASLGLACTLEFHLADVRDKKRLLAILSAFKPDHVFHAAALKHVPIIEKDWAAGLTTNIHGTRNVCHQALAAGARSVVIVSTDKAVDPVSVLGLSKRYGEFYAAALDKEITDARRVVAVRFGNVLCSSGSVVPLFQQQIAKGGPVTVTHPAMLRYFMTMREACDLVMSSAAHAAQDAARSASIYVLNMGQPVRILDLAKRMIALFGQPAERAIEIEYTGVRPGERLNETLFSKHETLKDVGLEGISAASAESPSLSHLDSAFAEIEYAIESDDRALAMQLLESLDDYKLPAPHLSLVRH